MKIKIQPWMTPNFLIGDMPARPRQEGFNPDACPKWALAEVDAETLAEQCDKFRAEVFRKAGKTDPRPTSAAFFGQRGEPGAMKLRPTTAWAIVDSLDNTIMERSGSGMLNIFYDKSDAAFAFPEVKRGADGDTAKRLAIIEIGLTPNAADATTP